MNIFISIYFHPFGPFLTLENEMKRTIPHLPSLSFKIGGISLHEYWGVMVCVCLRVCLDYPQQIDRRTDLVT